MLHKLQEASLQSPVSIGVTKFESIFILLALQQVSKSREELLGQDFFQKTRRLRKW